MRTLVSAATLDASPDPGGSRADHACRLPMNWPHRVRWGLILAHVTLAACHHGGVQRDGPPTWKLRLDWRIGSADRPGYDLTRTSAILVGPTGSIYVDQPMDANIREFDSAGRFVRTIGRRGTGPAEFTRPVLLGIKDDTLYIGDTASDRITVFDTAGAFLADFRIPVEPLGADLHTTRPTRLLPDGTFLFVASADVQLIAEGSIAALPMIRADRHGRIMNHLGTLSMASAILAVRPPDDPVTAFYTKQPFSIRSLEAIDRKRKEIAVVDLARRSGSRRATVTVHWIALSGDTVRTCEYVHRPVPLSNSLLDSTVNHLAERVRKSMIVGPPTVGTAATWVRARLFIPEFLPSVTSAVAGEEGGLYLRGSDGGGSMVTWWVLGDDGSLVARIQLPSGLRVLAADPRHLWGALQDTLGITYIDRYSVMPQRTGNTSDPLVSRGTRPVHGSRTGWRNGSCRGLQ